MSTVAAGAAGTTEGATTTEPAAGAGTTQTPAAGAAASAGAADTGKTTETPDAGKATGTTAAAPAAAAKKAPETYTLTPREEDKHRFDAQDLKDVEALARANDWTQDEAAAELVMLQDQAKAREARLTAAWQAEAKADPDFGGEHLPKMAALGKTVIDRVFPEGHRMRDSFNTFLTRSGAANKVEVIAFLATLGRMMGEDSGARQNAGLGNGKVEASGAKSLYDHPTSRSLADRAAS